MNKSLKYVTETADKFNKGLISDEATWRVVEYPDQLKRDRIEINGENIEAHFNYESTGTNIHMVINYDPDAKFRTVQLKGRELDKFPDLNSAQDVLSVEVLEYFLRGEWVSEKTKQLGKPVIAEFTVGDFISVVDEKMNRDSGEMKEVVMVLLPLKLNMHLEGYEEENDGEVQREM